LISQYINLQSCYSTSHNHVVSPPNPNEKTYKENVEIKLQTNCHNHIVSLANPNEKTYKENVEIKLQAKCLNASSPSHAISISMELIHLNERMFDD